MIFQDKALLEKAARFIASAVLLIENDDYDSAVSRLYYAMFFCAEALLLRKGLTFSSHAGVIGAFGQHFAKTKELPPEMHNWIREGFDKRQLGDYQAVSVIEQPHADRLMGFAERFLKLAQSYLIEGGTHEV